MPGSGKGLTVFEIPDPARIQASSRHREIGEHLSKPPVRMFATQFRQSL